jgi:hypothetical protein
MAAAQHVPHMAHLRYQAGSTGYLECSTRTRVCTPHS